MPYSNPAPTRRSFLRFGGAALLATCAAGPLSALGKTAPLVWDDTLEDLQRRSFAYFWRSPDADSGLAPDAWPNPVFSSIAAIGFGLPAYCRGVTRGYVAREDAAKRARALLEKLWAGPQGDALQGEMGDHGFFYHFLNLKSGLRF